MLWHGLTERRNLLTLEVCAAVAIRILRRGSPMVSIKPYAVIVSRSYTKQRRRNPVNLWCMTLSYTKVIIVRLAGLKPSTLVSLIWTTSTEITPTTLLIIYKPCVLIATDIKHGLVEIGKPKCR
jgi:hypothetical protein